MQSHNLKRKTKNRKAPKVGRGGKRGKTSGKGTKGQKARAGRKLRPEMRDIIKKIPKLRGHGKNRATATMSGSVQNAVAINLSKVEKYFKDGDTVSLVTLIEKRVVGPSTKKVKILSVGEISKKITIENLPISAGAKEKIEKAGGKIS